MQPPTPTTAPPATGHPAQRAAPIAAGVGLVAAVCVAATLFTLRDSEPFGRVRHWAASVASAPSAPPATNPVAEQAWQAALTDAVTTDAAAIEESVSAVDAFFDEVALKGIGPFLAEFSGPIDSATFAWGWAADKLAVSDDSARIDRRIRTAARTHLGLPDGLGRAIASATERFDLLMAQNDATLRPRLIAVLDGRGVPLTETAALALQADARTRAAEATRRVLLQDAAQDFGLRMAGKEGLILLLQTRVAWSVGQRAAGALAARTGLFTAGAACAGATAATGPPGWVVAGGEIAATIALDLALSAILERRAAGELRTTINDLREQTKAELRSLLSAQTRHLRQERGTLLGHAANIQRGGA
ncbi:MAG: hypothetical protein ACKVS8_01150 [Phycisphaerales bacterium]